MTTLQDRLRQVRGLATEAIGHGLEVSTSHKDSIDVAVVGEIKRGKSTFLNALMHSKVFPSRALVCTSAVTVLVDAPAPTITIRYKNPTQRPSEQRNVPAGSDVFDLMMSLVAKALKRKEGFQGNPDAAEIDEVEVGYPNKFATEGIRLVDTPGVNDPDAWREDITYRYLGKADAAIMLLDPQQPLSSSEVSFLRDKVQTRVKRQLLFVLNKSDQVSPKDRDASLQRIRKELKAWVDDPCIYPLAAKPALDAYLAGKPVDKDFADFECALDAFLRRGRAGGLLISRVEHIIDAALRRDVSLRHRLSTLDQEQGHANADLHQMEQLLTTKDHKLQMLSRSMSAWLDSQAHQVAETFRHQIAQWRAVVGTNPHGVRAGLDQLSRDLVTALEDAGKRLVQGLIAQFGEQLQGEVGELSAVHMASGHLQTSQFAYAGNAAASDESLSIGSGIAAGMLLGGPFGAVVGGVLGVFLGSQAQAQRQQMEEQRLIAAAHTYLTQLERNSIAQVGALVQGVGASIIPQLCQRLSADIAAESARVQASRRDMAQSASERGRTRNTLKMERQQITAFRERCVALKQDLHHV